MRLLLNTTALALLLGPIASGMASAADAGAETAKVKPYPLTTCVVSGDTFGGDMGEPIVKVYGDREIKLCCKGCIKKFEKDQAGYIQKIDEAAAKASTPAGPAAPKAGGHDHGAHHHH